MRFRGFASGFVTTWLMVAMRAASISPVLRVPVILMIGGGLFTAGLGEAARTQKGMREHIGSSICGLSCGFLIALAAYGKFGPIMTALQMPVFLVGLSLVFSSRKRA